MSPFSDYSTFDHTQDICISAIKEKDIESKLKQVKADWAVQNLKFNTFKARGEMLLKGEDTSAVVSLLEDSLMVLGSLMSNRFVLHVPLPLPPPPFLPSPLPPPPFLPLPLSSPSPLSSPPPFPPPLPFPSPLSSPSPTLPPK